MKITLCASLSLLSEVLAVKKQLEKSGYEVLLPETMILAKKKGLGEAKSFSEKFKKQSIKNITEKMRLHYDKIADSEAILVCNYDKNGIKNYIGPSSFLEMGIAFYKNKKIFLLNHIPAMNLKHEVEAMQPTVINNDLNLI